MASGSALGARADPQPDLHTRAHQSQVISKAHPRLPGTSEGQTPEVGVSLSLPAGQAERGWACSSLLPAPRPASRETGGVRRKAACSCSQSWAPSAQKTFPLSRSGSPKGPSSKPQGAQDMGFTVDWKTFPLRTPSGDITPLPKKASSQSPKSGRGTCVRRKPRESSRSELRPGEVISQPAARRRSMRSFGRLRLDLSQRRNKACARPGGTPRPPGAKPSVSLPPPLLSLGLQ